MGNRSSDTVCHSLETPPASNCERGSQIPKFNSGPHSPSPHEVFIFVCLPSQTLSFQLRSLLYPSLGQGLAPGSPGKHSVDESPSPHLTERRPSGLSRDALSLGKLSAPRASSGAPGGLRSAWCRLCSEGTVLCMQLPLSVSIPPPGPLQHGASQGLDVTHLGPRRHPVQGLASRRFKQMFVD